MNPYIGDRQLEPDETFECYHCGFEFDTREELKRHLSVVQMDACPECGDFDCNGQCAGDDMMGASS